MSAKDSSFVSMLVTLVIVTGVAALSLGFVYNLTEEPIAKAKAEKQMQAIKAVVGDYDNDPLADSYEVAKGAQHQHRYRRRRGKAEGKPQEVKKEANEEVIKFYPATLQQELSATAIQAYSDKGYNGRIELMVGLDNAGVIKNIEVVSHAETPGLGSKMSTPKFKDQFVGMKLGEKPIQVKKDGGQVDAISGATISSRAFCEAVQKALEAYDHTKGEESQEL